VTTPGELAGRPLLPRISVILPVRNRVGLVEASARTALDQTLRDLELIIVDGGSTDGTVEVLQRLAASDDRVRLLLNPCAEGVSAARNQGARTARGPLLAFLDSDDLWAPSKLELQLEALRRLPAAKIAYTGCRRIFPYGTELRPRTWNPPFEGDLHAAFLREGAINCSTLLADRKAFLAIGGFDESLPFYEDWDLMVQLSSKGPVACAPDWLVDSPQLPDGLSRDRASYFSALATLADKHRTFLARHPRAAEERFAELGWLLAVNRRGRAGRWLRMALAIRPLSLHVPFLRATYLVLRYKRPAKPLAPTA
jgi:glycosyltransferase involved in cell wall biosynthesis